MESSLSFRQRIKTLVPIAVRCLRHDYSLKSFFKDLFAGCNVAIIAFPMAIACAIGTNIDPERGLFTGIVAGFLISLLGGSRVQIGGPSSMFLVILYGIMLRHGLDGMLLTTFMGGLILVVLGLAGFGTYIKYIPYTIVSGLTTGIAVVIFSSQFKGLLGLEMGNVPVDFLSKWQAYWQFLPTFNPASLLIGGMVLAIMIVLRCYRPQLPGSLIALTIVTVMMVGLHIDVETIGSKYGMLPRSLPAPHLPYFELRELLDLVPDALTLAILIGMESLLSAVVAEGMTGWRHQSNCELIAQGIANLCSGLFGGMPATGSLSRTAANIKGGATTPVSGMIHACVLFLLMFLFAPFVSQIPLSALAAVLMMTAWSMSRVRHFVHLMTAPKRDVVVLLTVFTLTVLIDLTAAVQVGMILAAFLFMKQMSDRSDVVSNMRKADQDDAHDVEIFSHRDVPPDIEVFEINGPLFFGVTDRLKNILNELDKPPKIFILRMQRVPTIDASGMHALEELYRECHKQKTLFLLAGVQSAVLHDLKRYRLNELLGQDHLFSHINTALEFAREYLRIEKFKVAMRYTQTT